jgi:hypothetical protein
VPTTAIAAALNITVTAPTAPGDLRVFRAGGEMPLASSINYSQGQTRANNLVVPVGDGGAIAAFCEQASGTVHLLVDVVGFFQ